MGAQVVRFHNVSHLPASVYFDTNYLLHLQSFITVPKDPRYRACKQFYDRMLNDGVSMRTSILAIEEAIYIILYKDRLQKELTKLTQKEGKTYSRLTDLKRAEPDRFEELVRDNFRFVQGFVDFVMNSDIRVDYPAEYVSSERSVSHEITLYARAMIAKYPRIEPMDAFHIAICKFLGIHHIVTGDKGFREVDGITVFTYR